MVTSIKANHCCAFICYAQLPDNSKYWHRTNICGSRGSTLLSLDCNMAFVVRGLECPALFNGLERHHLWQRVYGCGILMTSARFALHAIFWARVEMYGMYFSWYQILCNINYEPLQSGHWVGSKLRLLWHNVVVVLQHCFPILALC